MSTESRELSANIKKAGNVRNAGQKMNFEATVSGLMIVVFIVVIILEFIVGYAPEND
jgi:hypothetical protein